MSTTADERTTLLPSRIQQLNNDPQFTARHIVRQRRPAALLNVDLIDPRGQHVAHPLGITDANWVEQPTTIPGDQVHIRRVRGADQDLYVLRS